MEEDYTPILRWLAGLIVGLLALGMGLGAIMFR